MGEPAQKKKDEKNEEKNEEGKDKGQKPLNATFEVEDLGSWKRRLKVEIPAESVSAEYEDALRELGRNVLVPGFRKGHVPRVRLLKQFGKDLAEDVRAKLVGRGVEEGLESNELKPASEPLFGPEAAAILYGPEPEEPEAEEPQKPEAEQARAGDAEEPEPGSEPGPKETRASTASQEYLKSLEADPERPLSFELTLEVKPIFDLPEYKGLKLTRERTDVTNEDVERRIDMLRRGEADYVAVEEGGAAPGDRLTVTGRLEVEGESIWDAEHEICHLAEDLLLGLPARAKREEVEGLAPGEERTVDVKVPDSYKEEEHRGKDAKLVLKLEELKRPEVPPLDDEAAQKLGAPDAGTLRRSVRERLEIEGRSRAQEDLEKQIVDKLVEGAAFDLPDGLFERAARSREMEQILGLTRMGLLSQESAVAALTGKTPAPPLEGAEAEAAGAGPSADEQKIAGDVRASARESTERNLKARLILEKVADAEKIEVTDDDLEEEIYRRAQASGRTPVAVRSELERAGRIDSTREALAASKVVNFIVEKADITDAQEASA